MIGGWSVRKGHAGAIGWRQAARAESNWREKEVKSRQRSLSTGGEGGKPADKPGSVVDSHSSRRTVASTLKQPTRKQREPRPRFPIWPCSRWGLPCRSCYHERGELLPHRFTLTCPGQSPEPGHRRSAFCCTFRHLAVPGR